MKVSLRWLAYLSLVVLVGCSDDDDDTDTTTALDGSVDSGARDSGMDARMGDGSGDASACAAGAFRSSTGCRPWSDCMPNSYVAAAGDSDSDRLCTPCPERFYAPGNNAAACMGFDGGA
jgi:hypothetical protein